jgi:rare lipoprotein A (peptidoglycan hydrolase)
MRRQDPWLWTRGRRSVSSAVLVRQVIYRSGTVVLLVVGTVGLLVGHQVFGSDSSSRHLDPAAASLTAHVAAHASPLAVTATVATGVPVAQPPAPSPSPTVASRLAASALRPTIASWYGVRPNGCYDRGQRFDLPAGIGMWVASRTLACGTVVQVTGPAGTALLLVEDHGPYLRGRDLDLSPAAFRRVAGPLAKGLVNVTYGVDPGASPTP